MPRGLRLTPSGTAVSTSIKCGSPRALDLLEALERNAPFRKGGDATWRRPRRGGLLSARVGINKTRAPGLLFYRSLHKTAI